MSEIKGSSVLILGYGREGKSTHRYLLKHYPHPKIGVADHNPIELIAESSTDTPCYSGEHYLDHVAEFETVIHTPVISIPYILSPETRSKLHITSATNLFFERCPGKIIAISGTKGKSTTTSLIAAMLKRHKSDVRLAGNIGAPMLDYLEDATPDTTFVLELSSFQLEDLHYAPHIAVLLNILPEHLDHHGSFEEYRKAKANITRFQTPDDVVIHNSNYEHIATLIATSPAQRKLFSPHPQPDSQCWVADGALRCPSGTILSEHEIPLHGSGNKENVLAATCCALQLGVPIECIAAALREFSPLEHRLEFVGEFRGIRFINDSLATIPAALANALSAFPGEVDTVIAGGYDRGVDLHETGSALVRAGVRNLILFPDTGAKIWAAVQAQESRTEQRYLPATSMEEAVRIAYDVTQKGKICLLSPAASSFNMFRDYRERGEKFKTLARELGR